MEEEYKFYRYLNEKSILVITTSNQLRRLNCPFIVKDKDDKINRVEAVASNEGNDILYRINAQYLPYNEFKIIN